MAFDFDKMMEDLSTDDKKTTANSKQSIPVNKSTINKTKNTSKHDKFDLDSILDGYGIDDNQNIPDKNIKNKPKKDNNKSTNIDKDNKSTSMPVNKKTANKSTTDSHNKTDKKTIKDDVNTSTKESKPAVDPWADLDDFNSKYITPKKAESKPANKSTKKTSKPVSKKTKSTSSPSKQSTNNYDPNDPIITPDGKRLSEAQQPINRKTNTPVNDVLIKAKGYAQPIIARQKIVKRVKKQQDAQRAKRIKESKFTHSNTNYTNSEKEIMRNLGMDAKEFNYVLKAPKDTLTYREKRELIDAGVKGPASYFKGKLYRPSHTDKDILVFLIKFKFASTRFISKLHGRTIQATYSRLYRLKRDGLVADYVLPGIGTIWGATRTASAIMGYELPTYSMKQPSMSTMPPVIGIDYVAACLWSNTYNVLFMDDFPAKNRTMYGTDAKVWKVQGEDLVSELELRSSMGHEVNSGKEFGGVSSADQQALYDSVHLTWHKWERAGRPVDSPEMEIGNEYLWIVFPESGLTVNFHVPDLVIKRERNEDGSPESIAVECELSNKDINNYINTMRAYKEDIDNKRIYKKLIWITNSTSIEKKLRKAAEEVGFTDYDVVPFTNESGIYKNRDIWFI